MLHRSMSSIVAPPTSRRPIRAGALWSKSFRSNTQTRSASMTLALSIWYASLAFFIHSAIPSSWVEIQHVDAISVPKSSKTMFSSLSIDIGAFPICKTRVTNSQSISQLIAISLSTCLNSGSPVARCAFLCLASAAAKQSAKDILFLDLK